jgi:uncharacterized protein (DUF427 family)
MPKAIWNGVVIAESEDTVKVEGNHYFPLDSVKREYLVESDTHTVCPWKGVASYYTLEVNLERNADAAWHYPHPTPLARKIRGRVAFWHGVQVVPTEQERATRSGRGFLSRLLRAA